MTRIGPADIEGAGPGDDVLTFLLHQASLTLAATSEALLVGDPAARARAPVALAELAGDARAVAADLCVELARPGVPGDTAWDLLMTSAHLRAAVLSAGSALRALAADRWSFGPHLPTMLRVAALAARSAAVVLADALPAGRPAPDLGEWTRQQGLLRLRVEALLAHHDGVRCVHCRAAATALLDVVARTSHIVAATRHHRGPASRVPRS